MTKRIRNIEEVAYYMGADVGHLQSSLPGITDLDLLQRLEVDAERRGAKTKLQLIQRRIRQLTKPRKRKTGGAK